MHKKKKEKRLTFGDGGGGFGIKADDQREHGDENPPTADTTNAPERRTQEPNERSHNDLPPKSHLLLQQQDQSTKPQNPKSKKP